MFVSCKPAITVSFLPRPPANLSKTHLAGRRLERADVGPRQRRGAGSGLMPVGGTMLVEGRRAPRGVVGGHGDLDGGRHVHV